MPDESSSSSNDSIGSRGRDIIVIGASAGGVDALLRLAGGLPADLPAAVLIVLHRAADRSGLLPQILGAAGPLPAADARNGEQIRHGRIYVAPPDRHLLIENGALLRLARGPKENHSRPAIDPLFRSAAQEFGPRVAAVILSGMLNDGTAGLWTVKRCGGVAIVQDPDEAAFAAMPRSALANVGADFVLPLAGIAPLLARLAGGGPGPGRAAEESAGRGGTATAMTDQRTDARRAPTEFERLPEIVEQNRSEQVRGQRHGATSLFSCPDCGGVLWQADAGSEPVFRCHVGHAYNGEILAEQQNGMVERSLWFAIRTLADRTLLLRQIARVARERGDADGAAAFERDAGDAERHGEILRRMVAAAPEPGGGAA
jgi:two-component system chemotaxis response regulator CheB